MRVRSRHDRLMQTYDVICFDINIFPLIRQTPGPPPHAWDHRTMGKLLELSWKLYVFVRSGSRRLEPVDKPRVLMNRKAVKFIPRNSSPCLLWLTYYRSYSAFIDPRGFRIQCLPFDSSLLQKNRLCHSTTRSNDKNNNFHFFRRDI